MPELAQRCIKSWRKNCPDYEIVRWDESNFDVNICAFSRNAYESGKYAFVSDVARLYALYSYGGIYLDTDEEIIKPLDIFTQHRAFAGLEDDNYIAFGLFGAEKGHPWIGLILNFYLSSDVVFNIDSMDSVTIPRIGTNITMEKYNWRPNGLHQVLEDDLHIYPRDYFCAFDTSNGLPNVTVNTYGVHHYSGSWVSLQVRKRKAIVQWVRRTLGDKATERLLKFRKAIKNFVKPKAS